jgi:hypothetical protein
MIVVAAAMFAAIATLSIFCRFCLIIWFILRISSFVVSFLVLEESVEIDELLNNVVVVLSDFWINFEFFFYFWLFFFIRKKNVLKRNRSSMKFFLRSLKWRKWWWEQLIWIVVQEFNLNVSWFENNELLWVSKVFDCQSKMIARFSKDDFIDCSLRWITR